jgi:hypothetical protein
MKKFIDHVDHVAWICRQENLDRCVETMSKLCNIDFGEPLVHEEFGLTIFLSWKAGLEIVSPHAQVTTYNKLLHERLDNRGEGMWGVIFGVENLEAARERARLLGYQPTPIVSEALNTPWAGKVNVQESRATEFLGTWLIFGETGYGEGLVTFE